MRSFLHAFRKMAGSHSVGLVVVVLLGTVLRTLYLGEWSMDNDEWYTLGHARQIGALPFSDIAPPVKTYPAIYLLTWISRSLLGDSELCLRLFPCLLGIASIPLFYMLVSRMVNRNCALLGALFIALAPYLLFQSQNARFYSGGFLFGMLAILLYYRAVSLPSKAHMWGGTVCLVAAVLFHPSAMVIFLAFPLYVITVPWIDPSVKRPGLRYFTPYILLGVVGVAAAVPAFDSLNNTILYIMTKTETWAYTPLHLIMGIVYNFGLHLSVLALLGFFLLWQRQRAVAWYLILPVGVAFILLFGLSCMGKSTGQRYMLPVFSVLFVLAGYGGFALLSGLFQRSKVVAITAFLVILLPGAPAVFSYFQDGNRLNYKEAARYISERCGVRDRIFCQTHAIFAHYLYLNRIDLKDDKTIPERVVETSSGLKDRWLDNLVATCVRVWIVVPESRFKNPGFYDEDLMTFIREKCTLEREIYEPRFDYHRNVLRVYLSEARSL